jgi:hypothetical protein
MQIWTLFLFLSRLSQWVLHEVLQFAFVSRRTYPFFATAIYSRYPCAIQFILIVDVAGDEALECQQQRSKYEK